MSLFDCSVEYAHDIFRNIPSIKESQHLFDDLSDNPEDWNAANHIEMMTHPDLTNNSMIQRAFDYNKNDFIDYPFENITISRYNDGTVSCWYGSENLNTSILETLYHFIQSLNDFPEAFQNETIIDVDRKIGKIHCEGIALDLTKKVNDYPWLVDSTNYLLCQNLGRRVSQEGHPLLRVPSARDSKGVNMVAFSPNVLSDAQSYCYLPYEIDVKTMIPTVFRGTEQYLFSS